MNHVQMRQLLVEQSGMRGLVTDADGADYSNKSGLLTNATYYLNAGLRWLNRRWTLHGVHHRHIFTHAQGAYLFDVPRTDFITRIDVENAAGERTRLKQVTLDYLRDLYPETFADVEQGRPLYFARNVSSAVETAEELIPDPVFAADPTTGGDAWGEFSDNHPTSPPVPGISYNATLDTIDWEGGSISTPWSAFFTTTTAVAIDIASNTYTLSYALEDIATEGGIGPRIVMTLVSALDDQDRWLLQTLFPTGGVRTEVDLATALANSSIEQDPLPAGNYYIEITNGSASVARNMRLSYLSLSTGETAEDDYVAMPPADAAYTFNVFGDFRTADLVDDTDENWWTINHPELSCRAGRIQIGVDAFRSASELEFFTAAVETELERMIANDRHAEFSAMTPTEFCTNG